MHSRTEARVSFAAIALAASTTFVGCTTASPSDLDGAGLDGARLDGGRLDGARLDGAAGDGARVDADRFPDGAPSHLDALWELDARSRFDAGDTSIVSLDAYTDTGLPTDAERADVRGAVDVSVDARDPIDGLSIIDARYVDGAAGFDAVVGRVDATGGGVPCGLVMCAVGLTCCPITGMCVPFGCPECCSGGPPPPPPSF